MSFLTRALKFLTVLLLLAAVVLWFASRRGDRGYFEEEVSIMKLFPVVVLLTFYCSFQPPPAR